MPGASKLYEVVRDGFENTNVAGRALDWSLRIALAFALWLVLRARTRHDQAE